ncbi:MAG: HEAT repeat domain-containing protein [Bacillota bacterium]
MWYFAVLVLAAGAFFWWFRRKKSSAGAGGQNTAGQKVLSDLERGVPEKFLAAVRKSDMETVGLVVDNLDKYEPAVRSRVILQLEQEGVVESYIDWLRGKDIEQKKVAARRLAYIGSPRAVMPLVEAVADKNEEVRLTAAGALKRIKDPAGIEPLIRALKEPMKWLPARIAEVLVELGPLALPALLAGLDDPDPEFKCYIIEILGETGNPESLSKLAGVLRDQNPVIRAKTAAAMGNIGSSGAVQALLGALLDTDKNVRNQAVLALRRIGSPAAVAGLAGVTTDPDKFVRTNAVEALGKLGDTGRAVLRQIAGDPGHPEKDRAIAILQKQGSKNEAKVNILYHRKV